MNTSFFSKTALGALVALSLGLTACAKKGDSAVRVAGRGGSVTTSATCSTGQSAVGSISSTDAALKSFVSATLPGNSFGTITSAGAGIDLTLGLKFDSSGTLVKDQSSILIAIRDSLVGTQPGDHVIEPYEIQFTNAYSGTLNQNARSFTIVFQDTLGWIQLQGTYDGTTARGNVTFQNYSSVDGHSLQASTLGTFTVPVCGLFK